MQTYGNWDIQELPLSSPYFYTQLEQFLATNGLRMEALDRYLTVQADGRILAGAGLYKDIIKCVAVAQEARSEGLVAPLVSRLIADASASGIHNLKVFTKPENQAIFESLGFRLLAAAPKAILMENGRGLEQYCEYLREHRRPGRNGVIVMNANPFTLGHKYLIDKASEQVDTLYVIPVKEDLSQFPYAERLAMIRAAVMPGLTGNLMPLASAEAGGIGEIIFPGGTGKTNFPEAIANPTHTDGNIAPAGPTASENYFSGRYPKSQFPEAIANPSHAGASLVMPGVDRASHIIVLEGSDYCISAATFPTYFLKDLSDAADTQMRLDLDLYSRWIAPALDASVRFVGSEPFDALTAHYNTLIPNAVEIPRLQVSVIPGSTGDLLPSASSEAHGIGEIIFPDGTGKTIFPEAIANPTHADPISASAVRAALSQGSFVRAAAMCPVTTHPYLLAELAERALRMELELPMKPGLVCPDSNGAHKDMDYALMLKGIAAIRPFFPQMALTSSADELRQLGIDAEKAMLEATAGVNTHRGAIFALGLALNAAGSLIGREMETPTTEVFMQEYLCQIAQVLLDKSLKDSQLHFTLVGARRIAASGYKELFEDWLPYYRALRGVETFSFAKKNADATEKVSAPQQNDFVCREGVSLPGASALFFAEGRDTSSQQMLLLRIMSTLDDTCILKRVGKDRAEAVKQEAYEILRFAQNDNTCYPEEPNATKDLFLVKLKEVCAQYAAEGISPGGAADMLALTIFIDSIIV